MTIGGRYHVLAELGRGGMGVVYKVRDGVSGQELALKQLTISGSRVDAATALFEREFYVLAQLAHPRVIAVHDYGHDTRGPYYTMELLDGSDLKSLAPLEVTRACALAIDVCSSLALLHARRFVHRDITPRNIRCTSQGHAKLIDFGAMVPMGVSSEIVGTPAFIAPEVVHRFELDARTDLFSLGATLYYALTGRLPYPARELAELRDAWCKELVPASHWVPAVPPALDALCGALLRIDPAQRPSSAFEVIQRLQTIAGIQGGEASGTERAFLQTPALVGRDQVLRRFRGGMRRALLGQGGACLFESESGLGRSRLLDACVLEAKTLGAIALRAAGSAGAKLPFAAAQQLAEQLLQLLPELAPAAARSAGVWNTLFEADGGTRLRAFGSAGQERSNLQIAFGAWIAEICQSHGLLIAVDDVHEVDEASIALLAALALEASERRLLIAVSDLLPRSVAAPVAFATLRQKCRPERLRALRGDETQALLASVFGNVPNVQLLADRLFGLAAGRPRETLALAQHLVDSGAVRYANGQWSLPSDLDARALPASASEAFAARVRALPPFARRLAEAQALLGSVMRREDYTVLAPEADGATLNAALLLLLERQILQCDAEVYRLSHRALAEVLIAALEPEQRRERHAALDELYEKRGETNPFLRLHHLIQAERYEQAFALVADSQAFSDSAELDAILRVGPERVASTLQTALELAQQLRRPAREKLQLYRMVCGQATRGDDALYAETAARWLAQLELDTGLADYRALDPALSPQARLQTALTAAMTRYAGTPEHDRGYSLQDAIANLCHYVAIAIVIGWRTRDVDLIASLPGLLEPFAGLSPLLYALWSNALASCELSAGYLLRARDRWRDVYEQLGKLPPDSVPYQNDIRRAAARGVASVDAMAGSSSALDWAAKFDADPVQRTDGMYFRRILRLLYGDVAGADEFGKQAELSSLRGTARPYFVPLWSTELLAASTLRDLAGVKRVIDALKPFAARYSNWSAQLALAQGEFELLRGDRQAARAEFERVLEWTQRDSERDLRYVEWYASAVAGAMAVASELGDHASACALGRAALELCERRGIQVHWFRIAQRTALAEAHLGHMQAAVQRIERVIELQRELDVRGVLLAQSHVIRTQIALLARDAVAAADSAAAALAEPGGSTLLTQAAQHEPLLAEARRAGLELALAPSQFEASVLGVTKQISPTPHTARLRSELSACPNATARAERALELVCELADAESGYLYLVRGAELVLATQRAAAAADADHVRFARGFFAQQIDDESLTLGPSQSTRMLSLPGAAAYRDARGRESQVLILTCKDQGSLAYVGLAMVQVRASARPNPALPNLLAVLAAELLRSGDASAVKPLPAPTAAP